MRKRRLRSRDVPHPERAREWGREDGKRRRADDGKGGSWPAARIGGKNLGGTVAPKAPPICMLYPDLAEGLEPAPVFGQFPRGLIGKILPWLRARRDRVLHVCSGSLPRGEGIRVDIRPEAHPDILADGRALPFADGTIEAVLLDPPYTEHYAKELYGTDYPRPSHLLAEAARVVQPGGRIGFVHYITPNPPAGARFVKCFALSMGFGFPMRSVAIVRGLRSRLDSDAAHRAARERDAVDAACTGQHHALLGRKREQAVGRGVRRGPRAGATTRHSACVIPWLGGCQRGSQGSASGSGPALLSNPLRSPRSGNPRSSPPF